ncbi:ferric iron reductase protein FhuF [Vreelandella songnenensis]|uniref:Ferric iron reductase protein FhuF n=1 Tax=Vreelandella songnenensis TaxID=1176243 RepID=A0A2T0V501_9GAMM|nr:siderophore-iron reductase FhuF [Halomonas songnenensis]PRY65255.1 ferric iron reductase protein FhuF [Halomonas songnenensis]
MPPLALDHSAHAPTLADCYQGQLVLFTPPLIGGTPPSGAVKASRWRNTALLEQDLSHYAARYPGGDKRAITSLWSKWHFSALTVPTIASHLLLNRDLPVELDDVHVILNEEGCTQRLWLPHEGEPMGTEAGSERFAKLIDQHWAPLIERLAAISGAAPRVFWSNAGGYLDYYVNLLAEHPDVNHEALEAVRALLESRHLGGQRNPLFEPVRTYTPDGSDEEKRVRKLCCLRYLLDEFSVCSNCPLEGCDRVARKRAP